MKKTPKVFLDANVVISAGKPPGGPEIERVAELVDADLITIVTTDLTIVEVSKKHAANDYDIVKEFGRPHFRKIIEVVTGTPLPTLGKGKIKEALTALYDASTRTLFKTLGAKTLTIDAVKPSAVFEAYASGAGFFSGEGKKDQFPDAFIFECLKQEATTAEPVIIVSTDGDFLKPVQAEKHISLVKSLPELFKALGLEMDAPEIDDFLEANTDALTAAVDDELQDWGLQGDVEDSEIDETTVTGVEIQKVTAFQPADPGGVILVVGRLAVKANVSYSHPNWDEAMYDSEDKVLIPFESVSGETEVAFEVDVSMSITVDETGKPASIEGLHFRNGGFQYVELHPYDPYEDM